MIAVGLRILINDEPWHGFSLIEWQLPEPVRRDNLLPQPLLPKSSGTPTPGGDPRSLTFDMSGHPQAGEACLWMSARWKG
jgi:hypothetical protein